jgi:Fe2+ transport system protein FeoA
MTPLSFSCPLCGHRFDPSAHSSCGSCPLNTGCRMVCCPNCGHSTVDPQESRLARWAAAAMARLRGPAAPGSAPAGPLALTAVPAPARVRIVAEDGGGERLARLRAYGLAPGAVVELLQQRPVTVVRIEQTELALEGELAAGLLVVPAAAG